MSRPATGSAPSPGATPASSASPFSRWSLTKLRDYLIESGHVTTVSVETIRRILHQRGVSWQATKTCKASTDQDAAVGVYIRWRNQRARPKTSFAAGSKIRHPDYPSKAA